MFEIQALGRGRQTYPWGSLTGQSPPHFLSKHQAREAVHKTKDGWLLKNDSKSEPSLLTHVYTMHAQMHTDLHTDSELSQLGKGCKPVLEQGLKGRLTVLTFQNLCLFINNANTSSLCRAGTALKTPRDQDISPLWFQRINTEKEARAAGRQQPAASILPWAPGAQTDPGRR